METTLRQSAPFVHCVKHFNIQHAAEANSAVLHKSSVVVVRTKAVDVNDCDYCRYCD